MSETVQFDVAVVGAGAAGLIAGTRLAEAGLKVAVLEKGPAAKYACNARMAGGAFHVAHRDVNDAPDVLRDAINKRVEQSAHPELVEAMASGIGPAVRWLKAKGVRFIKVGHEIHRQHTLAPPILLKGRNYWVGRGGDVMLGTLGRVFQELGGTFLFGTRAQSLVMVNGSCTGLDAEREGRTLRIHAMAVVLCDGGFQSNLELLQRWITPAPEKIQQRNAGSGNGDALRMASAAGAKLVGMNRFYGHLQAADAMRNDDLWPFPLTDFLATAGIVIDRAGQRFVDEGRGGIFMANHIASLADPLSATVIFDQAIWDGPGREFISPANPLLVSGGATIHSSPDIGQLGSLLGLEAGTLQHVVAEYNAHVRDNRTEALNPARTNAQYRPHAIDRAPFYAIRMCVGITYTTGGIAINGQSQALDESGNPIPGLYSAGCASGGLEGGEGASYIGGLTKSTVTAFGAANAIAAASRPA